MANSADADQLASSEANWSGSTLFAKAGYIRVQQDLKLKETQNLRSWESTVFQNWGHNNLTKLWAVF